MTVLLSHCQDRLAINKIQKYFCYVDEELSEKCLATTLHTIFYKRGDMYATVKVQLESVDREKELLDRT